ncbi:hypothetical protein F4X86_03050 [Candidatus Saccharibacteria bacterium]|nr:hypothetical protein [Candidatus Saccharibacteria bacterium]
MSYKYGPLSLEIRRRKLRDILDEGKDIGTIKIPKIASIPTNVLKTYKIPLDCLVYNPHNQRFASRASTFKIRGGSLNPDNLDHIEHIKKFLREYKDPGRNKSTIDSLVEDGQLKAGIVSIDGVILSGNRRFMLMNEIMENLDQYPNPPSTKENVKHFEAAIIDQFLDKEQILRLESFFQYGEDEKVDYGPIEKYLAVDEQSRSGFTTAEIYKNFQAIAKNESEIKRWLQVFKLMEEYLRHIGEPGIYTALYRQQDKNTGDSHTRESREELFAILYRNLKMLRNRTGVAKDAWGYSDNDIKEYKMLCFDYIRFYVSGRDAFRDFIDFFATKNKGDWVYFFKQHKETMSKAQLQVHNFDKYRKGYPKINEEDISKLRSNDFVKVVREDFNRAMRRQKAIKDEQKAQSQPVQILEQIENAISKFESAMERIKDKKSTTYINALTFFSNKIMKRINNLKQKLD